MIAVVAGVVRREGRVLLCQRPEGKRFGLLWEFPGGKVEPGESPEAALEYLQSVTVERVRAHDQELTARFLGGVRGLSGVALLGPDSLEGRVGVFSLDFAGRDNAEMAYRLETEYGILTRCGLHCAPAAHKTLGTFPRGTVRFSTGWFTTERDIDAALAAIRALTAE